MPAASECRPTLANSSTSASSADQCCGRRAGTAACSVHTARSSVPPSRQAQVAATTDSGTARSALGRRALPIGKDERLTRQLEPEQDDQNPAPHELRHERNLQLERG